MNEPRLMPVGKENYDDEKSLCPNKHNKRIGTISPSKHPNLLGFEVSVDMAGVVCLEPTCEQFNDLRPMVIAFHTTHEEILNVLNGGSKK